MTASGARVTVLCGGVGAARFLRGLLDVVDESSVCAVVNVGDDAVMHGLHVSPDIDTILYTLAGAIDPDRGWGLAGETWSAMEGLARYGNPTWFNLGDRDLATHIVRTERLAAGEALHQVTDHLRASWDLRLHVLPVTDDPVRTRVTVIDTAHGAPPAEIDFQEYFVGRQHDVPVSAVRFAGAEAARPAPGVIDAIARADRVVIAPSNPLVSIDPVLAVPGVRDALVDRRADVVAISPIVGGDALKGPAARMLRELGHEASAAGVAAHYRTVAGTMVIDTVDAALADPIAALGVVPVVTDTIMRDPATSAALARTVLDAERSDHR